MGQQCSCTHNRQLPRRSDSALSSRQPSSRSTDSSAFVVGSGSSESTSDSISMTDQIQGDEDVSALRQLLMQARLNATDNTATRVSTPSVQAPESKEKLTSPSSSGTSSHHRLIGEDKETAADHKSALETYQQLTGIVDDKAEALECVMCLDGFSEENPKVRTLCNCGLNRTNFHLGCLMEWLDHDVSCPLCRAYLYYEEDS